MPLAFPKTEKVNKEKSVALIFLLVMCREVAVKLESISDPQSYAAWSFVPVGSLAEGYQPCPVKTNMLQKPREKRKGFCHPGGTKHYNVRLISVAKAERSWESKSPVDPKAQANRSRNLSSRHLRNIGRAVLRTSFSSRDLRASLAFANKARPILLRRLLRRLQLIASDFV